jgi:hypothetical protein
MELQLQNCSEGDYVGGGEFDEAVWSCWLDINAYSKRSMVIDARVNA